MAETPALLLDLDILETNISRMAELTARASVHLRPHTKTHKATWIARRQLEAGTTRLTVAKLGEAEVMTGTGCQDLLVAFPIIGDAKLRRLESLLERVSITVALDSVEAAEGLAGIARKTGRALPVYVEVDSGLGRCGRSPGIESARLVEEIAQTKGIDVVGLMTHAGHAYWDRSLDELRRTALHEAESLVVTADLLKRRGIELRTLSTGSTPTARFLQDVMSEFPITEIRPGTYVFNDANQTALGVCSEDQCALTVLATVVARPVPDRIIIDAGSKTLGADSGVGEGYGIVREDPSGVIERLNEEHGFIRVDPNAAWRIGDRLTIIPNHACIPPNLASEYVGTRSGRVETLIPIEGRGRNR